jgi:hypothetical protein
MSMGGSKATKFIVPLCDGLGEEHLAKVVELYAEENQKVPEDFLTVVLRGPSSSTLGCAAFSGFRGCEVHINKRQRVESEK